MLFRSRYRGITGRRDVVFVNERDLVRRGLKHGDVVDLSVVPEERSNPSERVLRNLTVVAFNIAQGSIATYYPEANVLVALDHYDAKSGTPSYKSIPVLLRASRKGDGSLLRPSAENAELAASE